MNAPIANPEAMAARGSATLSEAANKALCWLMGEQASRMKCGEATHCGDV